MGKRKNARLYDSQEKYAEALNSARKNDGIIRCHRPARAAVGRQENIELLSQLFRRADCLEQELTEIRQQLNEIACKNALGRCAALHIQSPSSHSLHRDGSKRKIGYLILEEDFDLIQAGCSPRQNDEELVRSSLRQRVLDEL